MNTNSDRTAFATLFVIALYGTVSAFRMPLGQFHEPGPGFFPLALSLLLLLLSGLGILAARPSAEEPSRREPFWGDIKTPVKIVLTTALAVTAFEPAGFLLTSVCFLGLLFFWISRYPGWKAALLAAGVGGAAWFFFVKLLGVPLPGGFLGL